MTRGISVLTIDASAASPHPGCTCLRIPTLSKPRSRYAPHHRMKAPAAGFKRVRDRKAWAEARCLVESFHSIALDTFRGRASHVGVPDGGRSPVGRIPAPAAMSAERARVQFRAGIADPVARKGLAAILRSAASDHIWTVTIPENARDVGTLGQRYNHGRRVGDPRKTPGKHLHRRFNMKQRPQPMITCPG